MNFQKALDLHFPNTISEIDFIRSTQAALNIHGFRPQNSITCVGVCRDEFTRTLVDNIQKAWGKVFDFSSLGGMLSLGKTGLGAAHNHAPIDGGRERYIYFVLAHIAIDHDGEIGVCYRPGRPGPSEACGALIAFRQEMLDGILRLEIDLEDIEQSRLKHRMFRKILYGDLPDLVTLTKIAYEVILEDLEHLVDETVNTSVSDYAILSGIQIHGPERAQYIWPGAIYVVKNGIREQIELTDI
jgi:hypothetical protein